MQRHPSCLREQGGARFGAERHPARARNAAHDGRCYVATGVHAATRPFTKPNYGHERLLSDAGEWYATDALGSVRLTLDNNGAVLGNANYDPWGSIESGSIDTFGFTGELQRGDQVYLRARWYNAGHGAFMSRDPFAGYDTQPYSLHPYQYAYSNPVLLTDPSGECVIELRYHPAFTSWFYHADIVLIENCGSCKAYKVYGYPSGAGPSSSSEQGSSASGGSSSERLSDNPTSSNSGNSSSPGSGPGGTDEDLGPWGGIIGAYGDYSFGDILDPALDPRRKSVILDNDEPCEPYYKGMAGYVDKVIKSRIPYNPLASNSNALANGALREVGLSPPWFTPVIVPALHYNLDLNE